MSKGDWETEQVHFSLEKSMKERVDDIAQRQGKKPYELVREAVRKEVEKAEESLPGEFFTSVPEDGFPTEGDIVEELNFEEVWIDGEPERTTVEDQDVVRAFMPGHKWFDAWRFTFLDSLGGFRCEHHVRFSLDFFKQLERRKRRHY